MVARRLAGGIGALAVGISAAAIGGEAPHGETAITCTNVSSGANWQIKIDYDKGTVDSNPARAVTWWRRAQMESEAQRVAARRPRSRCAVFSTVFATCRRRWRCGAQPPSY